MDEAGVRKVNAENNRALLLEIKDLVNSSIFDLGPRNVSHLTRSGKVLMSLRRQQLRSFPPHKATTQFVFASKPAVFVSEIGIWFVLCLWQTLALEGFLS